MFAKFSVKKPLTVLVAVIVVLVLGVVSYTRMTPDLLPSIDLPYVLVMTPYPGATPEAVEEEISKPLEQAMATLENITTVSSSSAANYSMLIMEFTEDVNMDGITVDILQKINTVEGAWGDLVGTPVILKINPNMLPVMVAAVSMDGMETAELASFVREELLAELEGITGVASITADGMLEESVRVTLDPAKLDALNKTLRGEIDKSLADAEQELNDAQAELDAGMAQIESGKAELEAGKEELGQQTADAEAQLNGKQQELNAARLEINNQLAALREQLASLEQTEQMLVSVQGGLQQLYDSKTSAEEELAVLEELQATLTALDEKKAGYDAMLEAIEQDATLTDEQKQEAAAALKAQPEYMETEAGLAQAEAKLTARGLTRATLPVRIPTLKAQIAATEEGLKRVDEALAGVGMDRATLETSLAELRAGKTQLTDGIAMLEKTLTDLDAGQVQINEAMQMLQTQKTAAILELGAATTQLMTGEMQLQSAQQQLDQGLQALEDGRETAYSSADMHEILSMQTVAQLLVAQNFSMPAGYADDNGVGTLVSIGDKVTTLEELQTLVLIDLQMDGVAPVTLADVATVERVDNRDEVYARVDGQDGVMLSFSKQSTHATAEVSERILKTFEELSAEYPGLHFSPMMDQGDFIFLMVDSIMENLLVSALFSVLILFLFLKDLKPTLITLCSIPLSVMFALVLMYFSGVSLNLISMSALAVSIGMLVDNSVVVIENIYRLRYKGIDPVRAAVSGATQVAGAIASSTLTTVCVFLPIVFVEGLTRQLFSDMALTLGYALLASLIVALTLVPTMSVRLLRNTKERSHKWFDKVLGGYRRLLNVCLNHKAWVLILSVVLLVASVALSLMRGFTFMPEMSSTQMNVSIVTDKKTAKMEDTKAITNEAMARIMDIEGVRTIGATLASNMLSGGASANEATMYIILEESYLKQSGAIAEEITARCADLEAEITASGSSMDMMMTMFGGSGLTLNLYGDDLDALQQAATEVGDILRSMKPIAEVADGMEETDPELHFSVDKEKAAAKGLTVAQVFTEVAAALTDSATATTLTENGKNYDVTVVSGDGMTTEELKDFRFTVKGKDGSEQTVKLSEIATVETAHAPRTITREDGRRYMTVTAELNEGYNVTLVTADAQKLLEGYTLPDGVTLEFAGENETIMEAMEQMLLMLALGILLVYLVMVAQFQSLKSPFIVMFTIPLAFTGGFLGLLLTGMEVSVISIIGFVMLTGIIVNNGIVLVDYVNQLRLEGTEKREALLEAGVTRMRPILMTSITTILGLLMTALATGTGSEMMQPIAVVCIGGMVYATLMTLFVVPVMYDLFNRKELKAITDDQLTEVEE